MKRRQLLRFLSQHGCEILGEGSRHTRVRNTRNGFRSVVPRHREIKANMVHTICRQLDVPTPPER